MEEIQLREDIKEFTPKMAISFSDKDGLARVTGALIQARFKFDPVKKTQENPLYKKKYADLTEIIGATASQLAEAGLYIVQAPFINDDQTVGITTLLTHRDGGWIVTTVSGCPAAQKTKDGTRFDAQTVGIGFTYLARYALRAILNLGTEDDDGNGLVSKQEQPKAFTPAAPKPSPESELIGLPTSEERSAFATRLKALKQDSRLLKDFVQKETGKPWNESTKENLEKAVAKLEAANKEGKIGELLNVASV